MEPEKKDTLLSKMKKAKSFLDEAPKEKKELKPVELSINTETKKTDEEIKLQTSAPTTVFQTILAVRCILYRKEEEEWVEITEGKLQVKHIPEKGVQLLFILDNTRIILNMLVTDEKQISCTGNKLIFTGSEQAAQICTRGFSFKTEEELENAELCVRKALEDKEIDKKK